jgi:hypothetical protein
LICIRQGSNLQPYDPTREVHHPGSLPGLYADDRSRKG